MTLLEHNLRRVKRAGIIDVVINVSWLVGGDMNLDLAFHCLERVLAKREP